MIGTGSPSGAEHVAGFFGFGALAAMACNIDWTAHLSARIAPHVVGALWAPGCGNAVDGGEIGLDIDQRRAVDAVDVAHREHTFLNSDQLDGRQRNGVWPHWRAQRKGTARPVEMRGYLLDEIAPCLVHPIEQIDVTEEGQILEARRVALIKLDSGDGRGRGDVFWAIGARFERRADAADEIDALVVGCGQLDGYLIWTCSACGGHWQTPVELAGGSRRDKHCEVCRLASNGVSNARSEHP